MTKRCAYAVLAPALLLCLVAAGRGQEQENQKRAQTGLQFLSVVSDARAGGMGGAMTSLESHASALFFNPAGMAWSENLFDISFSMNNWIADINHNTVCLALRPAQGRFGAFGLSLQAVDYGDIQGTMVADNDKGFEDLGMLSPTALAVGMGYAKALSDRFAVGGQVKWVRQRLAESTVPGVGSETVTTKNEVSTLAFDFGTQFKTGVKSLTFGMSVRNFSQEIEYELESFQLPLWFSLGLSANVMDWLKANDANSAMILSLDATHPRDHDEQVIVAVEYRLRQVLSVRGGYIANNDEDGPTLGFGLSRYGVQLDYAYAPFGVFNSVQRVTARFSK